MTDFQFAMLTIYKVHKVHEINGESKCIMNNGSDCHLKS